MNEWNKHCARPKTNLAAAAVSARLFEEGHEFILRNSICSSKKRHCWTLALATIEAMQRMQLNLQRPV